MSIPLIVDTHAHIYSEDTARYPKAPDPYNPPSGKGTLEHMKEEVRRNGVSKLVMIQTYTAYRWDNRLTADMADANRDWAAGVCTLDPLNPESVSLLETYATSRNIRGTRLYTTAGQTPSFGHDGHLRLIKKATELGVVVCVLLDAPQAGELAAVLRRFPETHFVLDHSMNLRVGADDTLKAVQDAAQFPNLHAKLTFVPTGSKEGFPCADMQEYVYRVIEAYGGDRCLWGSDFPCELWCPKVTYVEHLRIFTDELRLEPAVRNAVLGATATRLFFTRASI